MALTLLNDSVFITAEEDVFSNPTTPLTNSIGVPSTVGSNLEGFFASSSSPFFVDVAGMSVTISFGGALSTSDFYRIVLDDLDFLDDVTFLPTGDVIDTVTQTGGDASPVIFTTDDRVEFLFAGFSVPAGGSFTFDITPTCFLPGTLILTDRGEIPVEDLEIGDLVATADGNLEPIKWIGRQTIDPVRVKNPLRGYPILVKAGALGENSPKQDLYLSPDHALLVDGLLINAGALVNGISIVKTQPTKTFVYYSVELEQHSLLQVEGTQAESYLPQKDNRADYDNGDEYELMYPNGNRIILWPLDYPRVSSTVTVPRFVRKRLLAIAHRLYGQEVLQTA